MMKAWMTLLSLALVLGAARGSQEVMKDITLRFGEALEVCRKTSHLTEDMMEEFFHFWREDFVFQHRELGCAIQCMSRHFNLLTDAERMHHENMEDFIKSFPDGEKLAKQLVNIIHTCEQQHNAEEDHCWRIIRIAECFKKDCQALGIAPSMEMLMAEILMESEM